MQCNPEQNPSKLVYGYQQTDPKVLRRDERPIISNTKLKADEVGSLTLHDIKTNYSLKLLLCEGQGLRNQKTSHRLGENICKRYIF